jgi:hypothetical protein
MNADNISVKSLSKKIVNTITVILGILLLLFIILAVLFLEKSGDSEDIAVTMFTLVQTVVIVLAGWLYIVYLSPKSTTSDSLRSLIDVFLKDEVCESLLYVEFDKNAKEKNIKDATNIRVIRTHINGTPRCDYELKNKQNLKESLIHMYVVMNIKKFEVVYYIPENIKKTIFDITIEGAVQTGYDEPVSFNEKCNDNGFENYSKLVFRRKLTEGFLTNPEERLFIANDISVMTRSILNEIKKNRVNL